ncbi:TIGR02556 family CRISPR-associated protein [Methanolobus sp. WCC1]|uniref:TIGR02556 family CRISPR-associated protein n=1 Tax=unclassified Methanolobus TaxID=2629569 RepID=UPI0032562C95
MIEAIKEIGEYALKKDEKNPENPIEIIIEDPASSPTYKHILAIILNETETEFTYGGIQLEEYSKEKKEKYLYKGGSSRGTDLSPTSKITTLDKTWNNKTIAWFRKVLNDTNLDIEEVESKFLGSIYDCLEINKDIILNDLTEKSSDFAKNENAIITLIINTTNLSPQYIGDINVFKKIVEQYYSQNLSHSATYKIDSIGHNQVCSVCNHESDEVYGLVTTYKFYNVDKPGFVSGGFDRSESWKNYPVCLKCSLALEAGKQYLEEYFKYKSYGINYYIIPKLLQQNGSNEIYEVFEDYRANILDGNLTIKKEYGRLLSETEEEIFELLSNQSNTISNNILFFEKTNAAFRILLYVEDVLPSRLRKLFEIKKIVDKKSTFNNLYKKNHSLSFTFGNIWYLFSNQEQDGTKYFLEIVNNIFSNKTLSYTFLVKKIVDKVRRDFVNDRSTIDSTLRGLQLLDYLNYLDLLDNFNGENKVRTDFDNILNKCNTSIDEKANLLFSEFPDFFNQPAKRAVFLQGTLTQYLLNIQWHDRGASPFRTKLHGLKLDEKLVKKLFPEIQNKLEDYGKNYYRDLETLISKYMLQAGSNWNISKDEINFYYVLGMNLSYLFKNQGENADE